MTLPNFVVIGAMKAGTVSLRHYLDEHPDAFLGRGGRFGEPNFFVAEHNWPRGRGWYESLFDGAGSATALGECSPSYTMAPAFGGVPGRMAQVVPNARLVYVVRDPIARHGGEGRDLLPPQAAGPASGPGGQPDVLRPQRLTATAQEVGERSSVHLPSIRPASAGRGPPARDSRSPDKRSLPPSPRIGQA
jgi:hypothetical protein